MLFILKGKVSQHRNWMTRSYAVAMVFPEARFVSSLLGYDDSISETIVSMCVAFALLFADVIIHWQDRVDTRAVPAHATTR